MENKRSIKRPRSEGTTGAHSKVIRRKNKKQKTESTTESPATPDGQVMSQTLSTFSTLERNRFEAFRRSTFRGDAVAKYVAHCLTFTEENKKTRESKFNAQERYPSSNLHQYTPLPNRDLKALVSTEKHHGPHNNPAQEITIVVATLAKSYAQRLVTASRKLATSLSYAENEQILLEHLREAHLQRVNLGLDPGFFMQTPKNMRNNRSPSAGRTVSICNGGYGANIQSSSSVSWREHDLKMQSAHAFQEAFEKLHRVDNLRNLRDEKIEGDSQNYENGNRLNEEAYLDGKSASIESLIR